MSVPVPQPFAVPFLGNVLSVDPQNSIGSFIRLAEKYGEIYKLSFFGESLYFVSTVELLNEICDEQRFRKSLSGPLKEIRSGVNDGLFTAETEEHNWGVAHRTLAPVLGPTGVQDMFNEMFDITTQLVTKWARRGPDEKINVVNDFTRLTLDTIALCTMGKRFNSFYTDNVNPFVEAMLRFLSECGERMIRTRIQSVFTPAARRQFWQDIATMRSIAGDLVQHRRANPVNRKDLLNAMLLEKDPKTGENLSNENILNNIITFLVAGHDTTSGLLAFVCYHLIQDQSKMAKAQQEIDSVVGQTPLTPQHLSKLPYLEAILRETLRLHPVAPGFGVRSVSTTEKSVLLGGKYVIPTDATIMAVLPSIGIDPNVYGEDSHQFRPERMLEENFVKLPANAWKPFGNGSRGCIGRSFAWQEALIALTLVLQNFDLELDESSYQLQVKQTLSIKPDNFYMRARLRGKIDPLNVARNMYTSFENRSPQALPHPMTQSSNDTGKPLMVLFGSNCGTCEGLAHNLALNGRRHGYAAKVQALDTVAGGLPPNQPVIIITSSYDGKPTDDATKFVSWLESAEYQELNDVHCAVFGCGHRDWSRTFQEVPRLIDSLLRSKGCTMLADRGESDTANMMVSDDFDVWQDTHLWPSLSSSESGGEQGPKQDTGRLGVEIKTNLRATQLRYNVQEASILQNELLSDFNGSEKRETIFKLPAGMTYKPGDYLSVLPINLIATVSRVLRRFQLPWDATIKFEKGSHTVIPTETELAVAAVLEAYVEITARASRKNLATISKYVADKSLATEIQSVQESMSVLSVLERYPDISLPFDVYLSMLPPIRLRQYSISSSPLVDPHRARIVYTVLRSKAYEAGVATNFMKALAPDSVAHVAVRSSRTAFHLPPDIKTPIIMACAGTGLAPFLGFMEERAGRLRRLENARESIGEAILFIGCRSHEKDRLFADEISQWEKSGLVKVYYAFSRESDKSEGCKYVQDRIWRERDSVVRLFSAGAKAYICGTGVIGREIDHIAAKMAVENREQAGEHWSYDQALLWWQNLRGVRYAVDLFDQ